MLVKISNSSYGEGIKIEMIVSKSEYLFLKKVESALDSALAEDMYPSFCVEIKNA